MKTSNEAYRSVILGIDVLEDKDKLVQIFELLCNKLNPCSIQEMADRESKSYNGILKSKRYKKVNIGKKTVLVFDGVSEEEDFPW